MYFFDTPDLELNQKGVVVRARRVQKKGDDSVVKLRPVVPSQLPGRVRKVPGFGVEVDAMPGGFVCSGSMKGTPAKSVREAVAGKQPLRGLFSKEQRAFYKEHAPEGIALDDLKVLGPIFVLKLRFVPKEFGRKLVAEMWLYPDNSRIRARPSNALRAVEVAAEEEHFERARSGPRRRAGDEDPEGARVLHRGTDRADGLRGAQGSSQPRRRGGRERRQEWQLEKVAGQVGSPSPAS